MGDEVQLVVLDLDGTLLDTETLVHNVYTKILEKYGVTDTAATVGLGLMPLEAAKALVEEYRLPCSPEEALSQSVELLAERWHKVKALPGAERLIRHLSKSNVPLAIASNSPRQFLSLKLDKFPDWTAAVACTVAGDEVPQGKPAPDIYLEIARRLGKSPANCLVVEDSPTGVKAAKAAGMRVVAVPSLPKKSSRPLYSEADAVMSSLLDIRPDQWGMPPFTDWVCGALPTEPWYIMGPVIRGFGRGSKVLGIPTANLPISSFQDQQAEHVCGIYLGWAGLRGSVYKMVMSVGWNPYFNNEQKTVEPWLLHEFGEDFYDEELWLVVVGYIRPEADFPSLEALVERIHLDGRVASEALESAPYNNYQRDPFLWQTAKATI